MLLLTAMAVGGILFYDAATENAVVTVETVTLTRQTVRETVICAGTVTAADGVEIYAPMPCVAGQIAVQVGDRVEEGDVLLTVDRTATLAMAVGAGVAQADTVTASAALPETVTAPAAGVISAVSAVSGELLSADTPCVVLSEGDGVQVSVAVRENMLPRIAVGQEVAVSGVAFDKSSYKGYISEIAPSARSRVGGAGSETVVDAVVRLADGEADDSLLLGLTAKAAVTVATREQVLLVPYECLAQDDNGEEYVCRVQNGVAERVAVTVLKELPEGALVEDDLTEGDVLVCAPEVLQGDRVAVQTEAAV